MRCAHPGYDSSLFRHLHQTERSWALADDEHPGFFVFGAVPMHLLAEMRDEAAGRHGNHIVLVGLVAGGHPPSPFDHGDEAIVGMEVRLAEIARLEPVERYIQARLGRVSMQDNLV